MSTFSVASLATGGSYLFGGLSCTPSVAGPDGSGSPGSATSVNLNSVTLGYPSSDVSIRPQTCYVYSVQITDPDDVGGSTNLVATSSSFSDGSDFGTNSHTRRWAFNSGSLNPSNTYFVYFDNTPGTNVKSGSPYSGGDAYDDALEVLPGLSAQFKIVMSTP